MTPTIRYEWCGVIADAELVTLTESYGGRLDVGWWDRVRPHSLGWVTARLRDGTAAGFVNVAWDGAHHAFLLDTKVRADLQRHKIGRPARATPTSLPPSSAARYKPNAQTSIEPASSEGTS